MDHLKVFANEDAAEKWFEEMIRKAWHSNMRSSRYQAKDPQGVNCEE